MQSSYLIKSCLGWPLCALSRWGETCDYYTPSSSPVRLLPFHPLRRFTTFFLVDEIGLSRVRHTTCRRGNVNFHVASTFTISAQSRTHGSISKGIKIVWAFGFEWQSIIYLNSPVDKKKKNGK